MASVTRALFQLQHLEVTAAYDSYTMANATVGSMLAQLLRRCSSIEPVPGEPITADDFLETLFFVNYIEFTSE